MLIYATYYIVYMCSHCNHRWRCWSHSNWIRRPWDDLPRGNFACL